MNSQTTKIISEILGDTTGKQVLNYVHGATNPTGQFDIVICDLILCQVNDWTTRDVQREIYRVLKPGGRCIVSIHNPLLWNLSCNRPYQYDHQRTWDVDGGFHEHRPVSWYAYNFEGDGLKLEAIHMSREYKSPTARWQQDFMFFELSK